MKFSSQQLINALMRSEYQLFTGEMNINLIGVRSKDINSNSFNDVFCVLYQCGGKWQLEQFECTTDPGTYYRENPINIDGTAIVVPGQYRGLWKFGKHRGRYRALVQNNAVTVYRDNNHDNRIDVHNNSNLANGFFGINCHRANARISSKRVDKWSAGCQVVANPNDFERLLSLCDESALRYGPTFTYTLLREQDI